MPGTLILCATPIGNLGDITQRLTDALESANVAYAEDTRRSRTLLDHLGITVPLRSYFVGNEAARAGELGERFEAGETVVLLTDAGMPAISDPGVSAVQIAVEHDATVTVIPGASAVTSALAVSGFGGDRFVFEGFLPRKGPDRKARIAEMAREQRTIVFFAAPSRLVADLDALESTIGPDRAVVVARELTKRHEEVFRGTIATAREHFGNGVKGEVTVVVHGADPSTPSLEDALSLVTAEMAEGQSLSQAVRQVADDLGMKKRHLYEAALRLGDSG